MSAGDSESSDPVKPARCWRALPPCCVPPRPSLGGGHHAARALPTFSTGTKLLFFVPGPTLESPHFPHLSVPVLLTLRHAARAAEGPVRAHSAGLGGGAPGSLGLM